MAHSIYANFLHAVRHMSLYNGYWVVLVQCARWSNRLIKVHTGDLLVDWLEISQEPDKF